MNTSEILVVIGGVVAIAWVNWWFFFAGDRPNATSAASGPNEQH